MNFLQRFMVVSVIVNLALLNFNLNAQHYKQTSELKSGNWFKIKVSETSIYALSYDQLKEIGISDPSKISLFGQDGGILPLVNNGNDPDDIEEIPIYFNNGDDGVFNKGDRVYFFLKGPDKIVYDTIQGTFVHEVNPYSFFYYYFIRENIKGKGHEILNNSGKTVTHLVNSFDDYQYHELDTINVIKSGRRWFGEKFLPTKTSQDFIFNFPDIDNDAELILRSDVISRSDGKCSFTFSANGKSLGTYFLNGVTLTSGTNIYANEYIVKESFKNLDQETITIDVSYNPVSSSSEGYLDYIGLHAKRQLIKRSSPLLFRSIGSTGTGNVSKFTINGSINDLMVWEITDIHEAKVVPGSKNGGKFEFTVNTDSLREFIAFDLNDYKTPVFNGEGLGKIENQNLHSLPAYDYVIVTHKKFEKYAAELAGFHREYSGLSVLVVDQEKIFNEFSSGTRDVSAIRNFLKMFYDRTNGEKPRYLLLFGDGTYDNKHMGEKNFNYILTYQSWESINPIKSYVSDDFFGMLDNGDDLINGKLDVGIGRFPVSDTNQARTMVKKVKYYLSKETSGDWRNNICFVGDDEDGNLHMSQANKLSDNIENNFPWLNRNKIFLDAYQQVSTAVGARYPDVNKSIFNQLKKGTLIVNYTGHGAEFGLAHERILSNDDIRNWSNWGKLPIFMTATCEFSRFDYVKFNNKGEHESEHTTGEFVVTYPKGGAIASFTTTRVVYSNHNEELNTNFYKHVFAINEPYGERNRFGDIIRKSKMETGYSVQGIINKRNFSLLGDPAIMLAYPEHKIVIDSINGINVQLYDTIIKVDTLFSENEGVLDTIVVYDTNFVRKENKNVKVDGALSYVTINGHVEKKNGGFYNDFTGILNATIFDKPEKITTLDNDRNDDPFEFELQNNILFKGKANVKNGHFEFSFVIPKDISYQIGKGRISCYAYNEEADATGWDTSLVIGGFDEVTGITDNIGPEIDMYMGNHYFKENGITNESPSLIVDLYDESGINTSTSGFGHEMVVFLDNNFANPIIMNDFYEAEVDDYRRGMINYPLLNLEPGEHKALVKVWDVLNNSSEKEIKFNVKEALSVVLTNVYTFPNPLTSSTNFVIEHNQHGEEIKVTISIYSMSGQLITRLRNSGDFSGYMTPVVSWDGRSNNGSYVKNGLYFYKVQIETSNGNAEKSSKMLIVR